MNSSAHIQVITPVVAAEMLSRNVKNRRLSESTIKRYTRMMKEGRWVLSGDSIAFDKTGQLIDGQHRLQAVIRSGKPQQMLVVSGLDSEVFLYKDVGKRRTAADVLSIEGHAHATCLASTARLWHSFLVAGELTTTVFRGMKAENDEIHQAVELFPDLHESANRAASLYNRATPKAIAPTSLLGILHMIYKRVDRKTCDDALEALCTGLNLQSKDPITHLRNRFINNLGGLTTRRTDVIETAALAVIAMNYKMQGRRIQVLRWSGGENRAFPQPYGITADEIWTEVNRDEYKLKSTDGEFKFVPLKERTAV